jgi:hypothetical protein
MPRKLIEEEKVDILIGTAGAPASTAMVGVATEQSVPMIAFAPVSSVPKPGGVPWAISVPQQPSLMVGVVVEQMHKMGVKNVGFLGFSDAWGDLVYNNLKATAEAARMTVQTNETLRARRYVGHRADPESGCRQAGRLQWAAGFGDGRGAAPISRSPSVATRGRSSARPRSSIPTSCASPANPLKA